jgi:alpha-D-ribose 1-methylphosphonate 5-triphosphate synthase subunit PhnG
VTGNLGTRTEAKSPRQRWMAVLARASIPELEAIVGRMGGIPAHTLPKSAEVGTIMIEARAGGTGVRFNMGEATVTRCVVRLDTGTLGFSYALGTDRRKALLAAILDARMQEADNESWLHDAVDQLAQRQQQARDLASRKAAPTKVDFFTMVRGSD